jgi:16S rRNA (cytidine1402-2'-O)-methyltransferase
MAGKLYLVATPIGNLQDITERAAETLRVVDVIACEDTRHTQKLLNHLKISNKLVSYHEHNEDSRSDQLVSLLKEGRSVAVVSDAGTPAINDPGYRIVRKAIENGIDVVPIPGPSAFVTALSASGLPTDSFFFGGFLPAKKGERRRRLIELAEMPATLILYEAPHRLAASLADCLEVLGDRDAVVARELTKLHEEFSRGSLSQLIERFEKAKPKGEIVILIDRAGAESKRTSASSDLASRVSELESSGLDRKAALKQAAKEFGLPRSEAYRELQNAKKL